MKSVDKIDHGLSTASQMGRQQKSAVHQLVVFMNSKASEVTARRP